jgi:hypothetical protein
MDVIETPGNVNLGRFWMATAVLGVLSLPALAVACRSVVPTTGTPALTRSAVAVGASTPAPLSPICSAGSTMAVPTVHVIESWSDAVRLPGYPTPRSPLLYLVNDTSEALTVRNLGLPHSPAFILESGARWLTSWGGEFFGGPSMPESCYDALRQSAGLMVGVFDSAGQLRGRILVTPSYLFGRSFGNLCLSNVVEPPWVVSSSQIHRTHPCE